MKRKRIVTIIVILVVLLVVICLIWSAIGQSEKMDNEGIVVKEDVYVVTSENDPEKAPHTVKENKLFFVEKPDFSEGDVLVSGITTAAPNGYIRIIKSINKESGEYVCDTEPGTLLDVFEEAHVSESFLLTDDGIIGVVDEREILLASNSDLNGVFLGKEKAEKEEKLNLEYILNQDINGFQIKEKVEYEDLEALVGIEFEGKITEGINVAGESEFKIWLDLELNIEDGEIVWEMTANDSVTGEILFGCSISKEEEFEKVLWEKSLPPIQFTVGGVPVVITNDVKMQLEGDVKVEGEIGTSFEIEETHTTGFRYSSKDGKLTEINEQKCEKGGMDWNTSAGVEGSASAGAFIYLKTLLYDSTGAEMGIGVEGSAEGEMSVSLKDPNNPEHNGRLGLSIYPKTKGSLIVKVPLVDKTLVEEELFAEALKPFWEKEWKYPEDTEVQNTENVTKSEDDKILQDLENGDFSMFAGIYKPIERKQTEYIYEPCNLYLDIDGSVENVDIDNESEYMREITASYYPDTVPISVERNENGSYLCIITDPKYIYDGSVQGVMPEEPIIEYEIYPKGIVCPYVVDSDKEFFKDTVVIVYSFAYGCPSEYNICYFDENNDEDMNDNSEDLGYEGLDWVAMENFTTQVGASFVSGTGITYTVLEERINDDAGRMQLVIETEGGEKRMIYNLPNFQLNPKTNVAYFSIFEYKDNTNYVPIQ